MKRVSILTTLAMLFISGYIGFSTNYTQTINANETPPVIPKLVNVPRTNGFNINIDLNSEKVQLSELTDNKVKINISKKDSIVYREVPKPYPVKEIVEVPIKVPVWMNTPIVIVDNKVPIPKPDMPKIHLVTIRN